LFALTQLVWHSLASPKREKLMHDTWTCLMVENGPGILPAPVRKALQIAACQLHLDKFDRNRISDDACEGVIQTEWKTHNVGGRSGVFFRAQVFAESGDYFVNFLLNETELERGADAIRDMRERGGIWIGSQGRPPIDELGEFRDIRKQKLN
jgi:hypothetical protein